MRKSIKKIAAVLVFAAALGAASGASASTAGRIRTIENRNAFRMRELSRPSISNSYRDSMIRNMRIDNDTLYRLRRSAR